MIKRINFYAGPGAGKSATAMGVSRELKKLGYNVEYISEYIKNWAYEGRKPKSFQQLYIFSKQLNREDVLFPHVDHVITDSPLLMNTAYAKRYEFEGWPLLVEMALLYEKKFPGLHVFLDRSDIPYQTEGRYEDLEAARKMDHTIQNVLEEYQINYKVLKTTELDSIVNYVVESLKENK